MNANPITCIIYLAHDTSNGKNYVGQTIRPLEQRKSEHLRSKVKDYFHRALRKRPKEFEWKILEMTVFAPLEKQEAQDWLNEREVTLGKEYRALIDDGGYSLKLGNGGRMLWSAEAKANHAEVLKETCGRPEWQFNHAEAMKKMHESPEHREVMKEVYESPEWKESIRQRSENSEWQFNTAKAAKKRSQDLVWQTNNAEQLKKMHESPEHREVMKEVYESPEWKESHRRMMESPEWQAKQGMRPFRCIETGQIWNNRGQCARELGLNRSHISAVLRGKLKSTGGLHFECVEG